MRESKQFFYETQIIEKHIDIFGHVNNAVCLELLEQARWDFITQANLGVNYIKEKRIGPVLLDVYVRFRKELLLREVIQILSKNVWDERSLYMETHQEIYIKSSHKLALTATFKVGMMDLDKRKLIEYPQDWLEGMGLSMTDGEL